MVARKLLIGLMLVTGGLTALVPTANAQSPTQPQTVTGQITCEQTPGEIRPLGPPGTYKCTLTVEFSGQNSENINPATITINAPNKKSWMRVIISPSSTTVTPGPNDATQTVPINVKVGLTQNAPAFISTQLKLEPSINPQNSAQRTQSTPTQIAVTPGYFNLYNVRLDKKIAEGSPDSSVSFPITIDNFSNGDTRFEFSLVGQGGGSEDGEKSSSSSTDGFKPVLPSPLVVRSKATGGQNTKGQATFQVFTPFQNGYVNQIGALQLNVDSKYATDTSIKGASSQLSTLTKVKGFYVPGPGGALAALSVLGAAMFLHRKRESRWDE